MARTLLLSSPAFSWREWLKAHRGERDLLCLDPSDPAQAPPGRLALFKGAKPVYWRFFGSLEPTRAPHVLVGAVAQMLSRSGPESILQLFSSGQSPLMRQTAALCAQLFRPDEILAPEGARLDLEGFPVGPEEIAIEASFPALVQQAQRKAQWLKLIEAGADHEVELRRVCIEGARLGSGLRVHEDQLAKAGLDQVSHAEVAGGTLLLVTRHDPEEAVLARALDVCHASRAAIVGPAAYDDLLCSFARQDGEDFGVGMVRTIDFERGVIKILSTAVAPTPVQILRLGGLRVDRTGRELGEVRPWAV